MAVLPEEILTRTDGLPKDLFGLTVETEIQTDNLYTRYQDAITVTEGVITFSDWLTANEPTAWEEILWLFNQLNQFAFNNPADVTEVIGRARMVLLKLQAASPTDAPYDARELAILWNMAVYPSRFQPVNLTPSVVQVYVNLAVEQTWQAVALRFLNDYRRTKNPDAPLVTSLPGSGKPVPSSTDSPTATAAATSVAAVVLVLVLIVSLIIYFVRR